MRIDATITPTGLLDHLLSHGYRVRPAGPVVMVGPASRISPELATVIRRKRHLLRALAGFRPPLTVEELRSW